MIGATATGDGAAGLVPPPPKGTKNRYLGADGTWSPPDGGNAEKVGGKTAGELLDYRNMTNTPTIPTSLPANGGNADTLDGFHASRTRNAANTCVVRDANGYVQVGYIDSDSPDNEDPAISQVVVTNGSDGYHRKSSLQHLKDSMGMRIASNVFSGAVYGLNSSTPYVNFLSFKQIDSWADYPISFYVMRRGGYATKVLIRKANYAQGSGMFLRSPIVGSDLEVYLVKSGLSSGRYTLDFYAKDLLNEHLTFWGSTLCTPSYPNISVSSLPAGYITPAEVTSIP